MVVLNKIDGQWDELKSTEEIDAEIQRQAESSAAILDLPVSQIFPVSAQKGLVAKINGDQALLEKSRLPLLEAALSEELIPAKHDIVCDSTESEFGDVTRRVRGCVGSVVRTGRPVPRPGSCRGHRGRVMRPPSRPGRSGGVCRAWPGRPSDA